MTKAQHTPGPWTNDNRTIRRTDGEAIAFYRTKQIAPLEEGANVRLIAAAPELFDCADAPDVDAAHDMLSELLEDTDAGNDEIREAAVDLCAVLISHYEKRRAAIAKATGQRTPGIRPLSPTQPA